MTETSVSIARHLTVAQAQAIEILRSEGVDIEKVRELLHILRYVTQHVVLGHDPVMIAEGIRRMRMVWDKREKMAEALKRADQERREIDTRTSEVASERDWLRDELTRTNRDQSDTAALLRSGEEERRQLIARISQLEEGQTVSRESAANLSMQVASANAAKEAALELMRHAIAQLQKTSELSGRLDRLLERLHVAKLETQRAQQDANDAKRQLSNERRLWQEKFEAMVNLMQAHQSKLLDVIERLAHPKAPASSELSTLLPLALQSERRLTHLERDVRTLQSERTALQYDHGHRQALEAENARLRAQLAQKQDELDQLRNSTASTFRQMAENSRSELNRFTGWVRKRLSDA